MDKFLEETLKANTIEDKKEGNARRTKEGRRIENRIPRLRSWLKRKEDRPLTVESRQEIITELKTLEKERWKIPTTEVRQKIGFIRYADGTPVQA